MLSTTSGLLLAATFFMPAIVVCNSPYTPSREIRSYIDEQIQSPHWPDWNQLGDYLVAYWLNLAAYLCGLLMAVGAVCRMLKWRRSIFCTGAFLAILMILNCLIILTALTLEMLQGGNPGPWLNIIVIDLVFVVMPFLVLTYMLFSFRLRPCTFLGPVFITSLLVAVWFGIWLIEYSLEGTALYGLCLSFVASCGLLLASIGEARALTGHGWRRTVWRLLTCRLRTRDPEGRCPQCDYYLFGLTVTRCPECGRPFSFEALGCAPEQLGFAGSVEPLPGVS